jgi:hypothetical protein
MAKCLLFSLVETCVPETFLRRLRLAAGGVVVHASSPASSGRLDHLYQRFFNEIPIGVFAFAHRKILSRQCSTFERYRADHLGRQQQIHCQIVRPMYCHVAIMVTRLRYLFLVTVYTSQWRPMHSHILS